MVEKPEKTVKTSIQNKLNTLPRRQLIDNNLNSNKKTCRFSSIHVVFTMDSAGW